MHDREWKRILDEINFAQNLSYRNVIDKIKNKLVKKHLDVYKGWRIKKFDINHLFPLQSKHINNEYTLLHISVHNDLRNIVKVLLAIEGINVNAVDSKYRVSSLHFAARNGHTEVVKILLENGAKACAVDDKYEITPLHLAARNGHAEVVEVLLKNEAGIDTLDNNLAISLHCAVRSGYVEIVKSLLKNGANVDATNRNSQTPLHIAARSGHTEVVRTLLERDANAFLKDKDGHTPRDLTSNDNIRRLLEVVERKQHLDSIKVSVAIGCLVSVMQTTLVIVVLKRFDIEITIGCIAFTTAVTALVTGFTAYAKLKPSAQVSEMQVVEVHDNQYNSEIFMI